MVLHCQYCPGFAPGFQANSSCPKFADSTAIECLSPTRCSFEKIAVNQGLMLVPMFGAGTFCRKVHVPVSNALRAPPESAPTKAGWGTQNRPSLSGPVEGSSQVVAVSQLRTAVVAQHRLHQRASIGGPRRGEPQWMPADEGRSNDQHLKIDSQRISVINDVY